MMNDRFYAGRGTTFELVFGQPIAVGHLGGEFSVVSGSVWLTRRGDVEDHVLTAGHGVRLGEDEGALVERLYREQAAVVAWSPRSAFDLRSAALQTIVTLARAAAGVSGRAAAAFSEIALRASAARVRC